jgi:hypothetical protein
MIRSVLQTGDLAILVVRPGDPAPVKWISLLANVY